MSTSIIVFPSIITFSEAATGGVTPIKKGALKNFAKFTGKHQCQSLSFNKVAGLSTVNFAKFLRVPFLTEHLRWLLLSIIVFASIITIFIDHIWFLLIENVLLEIVSQNDFITYHRHKEVIR